MSDLQVTYSPCTKQCLCKECENRIEHPIRFEGLLYNVTEKGYKCTKYGLYSTISTLKGCASLLNDVIHGELAEEHIKSCFRHPELMIRQIQKDELQIEYKY